MKAPSSNGLLKIPKQELNSLRLENKKIVNSAATQNKMTDFQHFEKLVVPTGLLFIFKPAYYQRVTLTAFRCSLGSPAKIGWWWEFLMGSKVEKKLVI